jgi:hypothetical protein
MTSQSTRHCLTQLCQVLANRLAQLPQVPMGQLVPQGSPTTRIGEEARHRTQQEPGPHGFRVLGSLFHVNTGPLRVCILTRTFKGKSIVIH